MESKIPKNFDLIVKHYEFSSFFYNLLKFLSDLLSLVESSGVPVPVPESSGVFRFRSKYRSWTSLVFSMYISDFLSRFQIIGISGVFRVRNMVVGLIKFFG